MAAGDATAADVPGKYDCVINGKGYVFADSIEPSLPFRTHRAIYDISQTFVERQNVSNIYGDQAQDFFLTAHQEDWSLGQGQRFFRANDPSSVRRFFTSGGLDLSFPGQLALMRTFTRSVNASKAIAISNTQTAGVFAYRSTGATASLKTIDTSGTLVDKGDPGAGTQSQWGICTDGVSTFIAGTTTIRRWDGAAYSNFGANPAVGALAFHNNALYSCDGSVLKQYDGTGTATTVFTWKDATNTALPAFGQHPKILSWGGKLLIFFPQLERKPKLYVYDGTGVSLLAELPVGTIGYDLYEVDGIIFMSAGVSDLPGGMESTSFGAYAAVYYLSDGTLGELWRDTRFLGSLSKNLYGLPALGGLAGRLIFASANSIYMYDVGTGAISLIGGVPVDSSPLTGQSYEVLACDPSALLYGESGSGRIDARVYPATTYTTQGQLVTSWFDFDSSLTKSFRGVTLDWTSSNDGSIDIQYEVDGGILTTLQTGAVAGTEYTFPAATSGHKIRLTILINMGSTAAPILKRLSIRAAPQLKQFRSGTYILDCTGSPDEPRELRDGEYHPLTGYEQVQNLLTAAKATTPFTVVDRLGSFTALIDLSDAEGFDIYEVHPNTDNPKKSGSYFARIKVREV